MRIQEMRSGNVHLRKRMDEARETIASDPAVDDALFPDDVPAVESRLDRPDWSVVSFDRLEAGGLTYRQAEGLMAALDAQGIAGLCIVTDEAAARMPG